MYRQIHCVFYCERDVINNEYAVIPRIRLVNNAEHGRHRNIRSGEVYVAEDRCHHFINIQIHFPRIWPDDHSVVLPGCLGRAYTCVDPCGVAHAVVIPDRLVAQIARRSVSHVIVTVIVCACTAQNEIEIAVAAYAAHNIQPKIKLIL